MAVRKRARRWIGEMIGRVAVRASSLYGAVTTTIDATKADYRFWDELARGKRATYKLAGLFVQPIIHHIVAWALGKGVTARCDHPATEKALNEFLGAELKTLIDWVSEGMRLGDSYLVVNPDGSLTQVPPNQVEIIPDDLEPRRVLGYRIVSKLDRADITDEFRLEGRTIRVKVSGDKPLDTVTGLDQGGTIDADGARVHRFLNVIGRLPVVHYANNRGSNELHGRPEVEALLELLGEYDDTLTKTLQGVKLMGNPIPAMDDVEDIDAALNAIATGTKTITTEEGEQLTVPVVDFDSLDMIITNGKFGFKSPAPFTDDAWRMLKNLFYLMLQHSHVPEWVWGGAIASSKASVDAQMPAWELFISLRRMQLDPLIVELLKIWVAYRALVEPGLDADADIVLQWPGLTDENEELKLKKIEFARKEGLMTRKTALGNLDLVKDPAAEIEAADEEAEAAAAEFEAQADREIARLAGQGGGEEDDDEDADDGRAAA